MDCREASQILVDYIYQELDAPQAASLEDHLARCECCAGELAGFQRTRQAMRELPEVDPSAKVLDRLAREAARAVEAARPVDEARPRWWERLRASLRPLVMHPAMAAAVTLVVVLGVASYALRRPHHSRALLSDEGLSSEPVPAGAVPSPSQSEALAMAAEERASAREIGPGPLGSGAAGPAGQGPPAAAPSLDRTATRGGARLDEGLAGKLESARAAPARRAKARGPAKSVAEQELVALADGDRDKAPAFGMPGAPPAGSGRARGRASGAGDQAPSGGMGGLKAGEPPIGGASWQSARLAAGGAAAGPDDDSQAEATSAPSQAAAGAGTRGMASAEPWLARGDKAAADGRCSEALSAYNRAIELEPDSRRAAERRARTCIEGLVASGERQALVDAKTRYRALSGAIQSELHRTQAARRSAAQQQRRSEQSERGGGRAAAARSAPAPAARRESDEQIKAARQSPQQQQQQQQQQRRARQASPEERAPSAPASKSPAAY